MRQAILDANSNLGDDTISLTNLTGQIMLVSELPIVTGNTVILGPGTNLLTISGNQQVRIFGFASGSTNFVIGLRLVGALATNNANGAAISNGGWLTVGNCVLSNNQTYGGFGGAIYNSGYLTVLNSVLSSNRVVGGTSTGSGGNGGYGGGGGGFGGCIFSTLGSLVFSNSVALGNVAQGGDGFVDPATVVGPSGAGGRGGGPNGGDGGIHYTNQSGTSGMQGGFGGGGGGGGAGGDTFSDFQSGVGGVGGFGGGGGGGGFGGTINRGYADGGAAGFGGGGGTTFNGGGGGGFGGAIFVANGSCMIEKSTLFRNRARGGRGGDGQYNPGSISPPAAGSGWGIGGGVFGMNSQVVVSNSTFSENVAEGVAGGNWEYRGGVSGNGVGGAIATTNSILKVSASLICSNQANGGPGGVGFRFGGAGGDGSAAGIYCASGTNVLLNSTLSRNVAFGGSGLLGAQQASNPGNATSGAVEIVAGNCFVTNCTLAFNVARAGQISTTQFQSSPPLVNGSASGAGLAADSGMVVLLNNLFATNQAIMVVTNYAGGVLLSNSGPDDVWGGITSQGYNLLVSTSNLTGLVSTDLTNVPPNIGLLLNNGGPTFTHALAPNSPARDAGTSTNAPPVDQRGIARPQGGAVDIGAFEAQNVTVLIDGQVVLAGAASWVGSAQITLQTIFTNGTILYTLDGTQPEIGTSTLYSGPFIVTNSVVIRAIAYDGSFQQSAFSDTVNLSIISYYSLSFTTNGQGSIQANPPSGPYASGTVVNLTATPAPNWSFKEWSGSVTGSSPTVNVAMDGNKAVTAVFLPIPVYTLNVSNVGLGSVSLSPPGGVYLSNALVTLTATPTGNSVFNQWSGDATGTNNPLQITMNTNKSVQAMFTRLYSIATVTAGGGSISLNPAGGIYTNNSAVTLTASPSNGWTFLQWLGDADGTNSPTNIVVNSDKKIEALFGTTLGTAIIGNGSVTVQPQAPLYPFGYRVHLAGVPQPSNYFALWGNAVSSTNNPIDFTITNASPSVTAVFSSLSTGQVALSIAVEGGGHVDINPYSNRYAAGQTVNLQAIPDTDESFLGWIGDISETNASIAVLLDVSKVATAHFTRKPRLGISWSGVQPNSGEPRLFIVGELGSVVVVEAIADLGQTNWPAIATLTNTYGRSVLSDSAATNFVRRFYRGKQLP